MQASSDDEGLKEEDDSSSKEEKKDEEDADKKEEVLHLFASCLGTFMMGYNKVGKHCTKSGWTCVDTHTRTENSLNYFH